MLCVNGPQNVSVLIFLFFYFFIYWHYCQRIAVTCLSNDAEILHQTFGTRKRRAELGEKKTKKTLDPGGT